MLAFLVVPSAMLANYHEQDGLAWHQLITTWFWRPEVSSLVPAGFIHFLVIDFVLCSFLLFICHVWSLVFFVFETNLSSLFLSFHTAFLPGCV